MLKSNFSAKLYALQILNLLNRDPYCRSSNTCQASILMCCLQKPCRSLIGKLKLKGKWAANVCILPYIAIYCYILLYIATEDSRRNLSMCQFDPICSLVSQKHQQGHWKADVWNIKLIRFREGVFGHWRKILQDTLVGRILFGV